MFTSTGLFGEIPCPKFDQCQLINCVFSHDRVQSSAPDTPLSTLLPQAPPQPPLKVREDDEPARKRRRLGSTDLPKSEGKVASTSEGAKATSMLKPSSDQPVDGLARNGKSDVLLNKEISPPPLRVGQNRIRPDKPGAEVAPPDTALKRPGINNKAKETLNPRSLSKPPASHAIRLSILKLLHDAMTKLNSEVAKDQENYKKALVLSPEELVTLALDEEEQPAKEHPSVYSNIVKNKVATFKKMKVDDWKDHVLKNFTKKYFPASLQPAKKLDKEIKTGLSRTGEIAMLPNLLTPLEGLEKFGYVTSAPTEREIEQARQGVQAAEGYETCDRCGSRFQSFPGRREDDGALTSGGSCTYHYGKPVHFSKGKPAYYSCCNEGLGESTGCTKGESHVFKVSEVKRLAAILQFETTPERLVEKLPTPVSFDCEMGYTTLGLELIRLTATAWPSGESIIDVLVRPMGEILDLNSRYSGVFPEHFARANPYEEEGGDATALEVDEPSEKRLKIVDSPAAARSILFSFLQPETPLIGHAIDNDLNACRIIHPTIIDTVLLYPHPKGLPIRFGLRVLAQKYLERNIQTGGARGHDSKEDAVATGDLVRVKVASKWEQMKREGWTVRADAFYPPLPPEELPNKRIGVAGQK
jgi:hypothetical protein